MICFSKKLIFFSFLFFSYEQLRKNAKPFDVNDVGNRSEHSFENIENTVDFHEWLHEKQVEMAPKPNRADVVSNN